MDALIMRKIEEDPDLELDINEKHVAAASKPLLDNQILHEDEDELVNRALTIDRFWN